ncbi:MAG: hypothetical protein N2712_03955 [Brevinematales bacterium]|nr:hypothetical protein [Brevinematales bacterium]
MKKIFFSLRRTKFIVFSYLFVSIIGVVFLASLIVFTKNMLISYTKGASLLISYVKEYFLISFNQDLFSRDKLEDIERKVKGFYVFYDILNSRDLPYQEIEKAWLEFGINKDEISYIVNGTKIIRNTPFVYELKVVSDKLANDLKKILNGEKVPSEIVISNLEEFHLTFYKAMDKMLKFIIIVVSTIVLLIVIPFSIFLVLKMNSLSEIINKVTHRINQNLKGTNYEEIDLIDPRSEFIILQETVNSVSDKLNHIQHTKNQVIDKMNQINQLLSNVFTSVYDYIKRMEDLKSNTGNIEVEHFSESWNKFSSSFSKIDSNIKRLYENFDKFRKLSLQTFEPISSMYEILINILKNFELIKQVFFKYIHETRSIINSVQSSFSKEEEKVLVILDEMKRISSNLRSLGINASIEFSKISTANEALSNISSKIVDISKDINSMFGNLKSSIESFEIELKNNMDKLSSFITSLSQFDRDIQSMLSALETLSTEKETTNQNITSAYNSISNILDSVSNTVEQNEVILSAFYDLEENFKHIMKLIEVVISLVREVDKNIGIVQSVNDIVHELRRISDEISSL